MESNIFRNEREQKVILKRIEDIVWHVVNDHIKDDGLCDVAEYAMMDHCLRIVKGHVRATKPPDVVFPMYLALEFEEFILPKFPNMDRLREIAACLKEAGETRLGLKTAETVDWLNEGF